MQDIKKIYKKKLQNKLMQDITKNLQKEGKKLCIYIYTTLRLQWGWYLLCLIWFLGYWRWQYKSGETKFNIYEQMYGSNFSDE